MLDGMHMDQYLTSFFAFVGRGAEELRLDIQTL